MVYFKFSFSVRIKYLINMYIYIIINIYTLICNRFHNYYIAIIFIILYYYYFIILLNDNKNNYINNIYIGKIQYINYTCIDRIHCI